MISLDTEVLRNLAVAAQSATEEMETASQLLNQITAHNDWGCKERVTINSFTEYNRKKINELVDSSRGFSGVLMQVLEEFLAAENEISDLFEGVEGLIEKIISIPVAQALASPDIINTISENSDRTINSGIRNVCESLQTVEFGAMLSGMEG